MKAKIVPVGVGSLAITSDDFLDGFEAGKRVYLMERMELSVSDRHVTSLLMERLEDVEHVELFNFGYVVGWFAGFANDGPGEHGQEARL